MNNTKNDDSVIETMVKVLLDQNIDLEKNDDLKKFIVIVVEDIYGHYSLNEYSRILNLWKRDSRLIKTKVFDSLKNKKN